MSGQQAFLMPSACGSPSPNSLWRLFNAKLQRQVETSITGASINSAQDVSQLASKVVQVWLVILIAVKCHGRPMPACAFRSGLQSLHFAAIEFEMPAWLVAVVQKRPISMPDLAGLYRSNRPCRLALLLSQKFYDKSSMLVQVFLVLGNKLVVTAARF